MHVTIKNLTLGVRVFKNLRGQDVTIQSQETRSFEMHPHHVRQVKREAEKAEPRIELSGDQDEIAEVDHPGGNMTGEEKAKKILARQAEEQRLHGLRVQAGLEPVSFDQPYTPGNPSEHAEEAANEPMAHTDPATAQDNPVRNQRRKYR